MPLPFGEPKSAQKGRSKSVSYSVLSESNQTHSSVLLFTARVMILSVAGLSVLRRKI